MYILLYKIYGCIKRWWSLEKKKKISGAEWKRFSIKLDPFLSVIPVIKFSGSHSSSFTSQVFYGREEIYDIRGGSSYGSSSMVPIREGKKKKIYWNNEIISWNEKRERENNDQGITTSYRSRGSEEYEITSKEKVVSFDFISIIDTIFILRGSFFYLFIYFFFIFRTSFEFWILRKKKKKKRQILGFKSPKNVCIFSRYYNNPRRFRHDFSGYNNNKIEIR